MSLISFMLGALCYVVCKHTVPWLLEHVIFVTTEARKLVILNYFTIAFNTKRGATKILFRKVCSNPLTPQCATELDIFFLHVSFIYFSSPIS